MLFQRACTYKGVCELDPIPALRMATSACLLAEFDASIQAKSDLHQQLGFPAITWKFISPSIYSSPPLGEDEILLRHSP